MTVSSETEADIPWVLHCARDPVEEVHTHRRWCVEAKPGRGGRLVVPGAGSPDTQWHRKVWLRY